MNKSVTVAVVRVFTDESGNYGNPVGIVADEGKQLSQSDRQSIATQLGYSETVFINDLAAADLSIYNTTQEIPFAGHAVIGAAWFINANRQAPLDTLRCGGMKLATWIADGVTWVRAPLDIMPAWNHEQYPTRTALEQVTTEEAARKEHTFAWAWIDEAQGLVRARTFLLDWGILEDQGNGSGAMQCANELQRELKILHGVGSVIHSRPAKHNMAEVGGTVARDATRDLSLVS